MSRKKSKNGWEKWLDYLLLLPANHMLHIQPCLMVFLANELTYLMRTECDISDLLEPLEEAIRHSLLPALTGRTGLNDVEGNLIELPASLGGLGIMNPTKCALPQQLYVNNSPTYHAYSSTREEVFP